MPGLVARECGLTQQMADAVIDGFALDADDWRPGTENDLYRYCFHVAGAVGVMMAVVMGIDAQNDAVLDRACDLGFAFQLANIARDVAEDAAAGRCYLPQDWLAAAGIDEEAGLGHVENAQAGGFVCRSRTNVTIAGSTDAMTIPMTISERFCFTQGMFPNRKPAYTSEQIHSTAPMML